MMKNEHTVLRINRAHYNTLQKLKAAYPGMRHTALIQEAIKEPSRLTPFDGVKGLSADMVGIRITKAQLSALKEEAKEINIPMMQVLGQKIFNIAKRLGV
ncbi:hypothetical protein R0595_001288 [Pluralibacter gergoviae]|nr:hypothetical protein [Pluralibacter gergoviae]ELW9440306.1 hypothetical protein [Pluralibacter gergoviae]